MVSCSSLNPVLINLLYRYSAKQLYDVVSDIQSYPRFVSYCTGTRILSRTTVPSPGHPDVVKLQAELTVRFLAFEAAYTSDVTCTPNMSVEVSLVFVHRSPRHFADASSQAVASPSSNPIFKTLTTVWRFQPASPRSPHPSSTLPPKASSGGLTANDSSPDHAPTLVTLDLAFLFHSSIFAGASQLAFSQVSKMMVAAFEERCLELYGPGDK